MSLPDLTAVAARDNTNLPVLALATQQGQPTVAVQRQQGRLQCLADAGEFTQALKLTVSIEPGEHRVLGTQFEIQGKHHAAIGQRQRCVPDQVAEIPQPSQRQLTDCFQAGL